MKKFVAAFDSLSFSDGTMEYAIHLATHCRAYLVGVFLEDFTRHSYGLAELSQYSGEDFDTQIDILDTKDDQLRDENIEKFKEACRNSGLSFAVHRDRNIALQELLQESIYADLLIIRNTETMTRYKEEAPTRFLRDLLNEVQCPVMVVPEDFRPFEKTVILYDGDPSSVHAAKTYSYLLDGFYDTDVEVVTAKVPDEENYIPNARLIKEFSQRHFPQATYVVLKGHAEDAIGAYLMRNRESSLVVLGAYQRSRLSRFFRPSMADYLMRHLAVPLLIAHNR